jgi:hypothetical protein
MDAALVTREGIRTDGPFAEGKEVIGGYWIIVAESLAAARAAWHRYEIGIGIPCCRMA